MSENNHSSTVIEIPLTKGFIAIVDEIDADLTMQKWCSLVQPTGNVYAKCAKGFKNKHRTILLHKVILERILGRELVRGEKVDHKNGNTLDDTRSNLRLATHAQNMRNTKKRKNNTSGYKGVNFFNGKWRAQIQHEKKNITIGMFDTAKQAHEAYCAKAVELQGEFARFE